MDMRPLARELKKFMQKNKLDDNQLAILFKRKGLNVSVNTVISWRRESKMAADGYERFPYPKHLRKLSKILNIPINIFYEDYSGADSVESAPEIAIAPSEVKTQTES